MSTIATMTPVLNPSSCDVWDEQGELTPLTPARFVQHEADVAVIVVSRNRPDLVDNTIRQIEEMGRRLAVDTYVVEMGTDADRLSPHCSLRYDDPDFRGKCYGHNVGLRLARSLGRYRYYWILMNDLVFDAGRDTLQELVDVADANPTIAILSPTEPLSDYPECRPRPSGDYHPVSTCDYLAILVRAECVDEVGFLNPDFKYCWGAIHEFAYQLYAKRWQVAYCDRVTMEHLGGTTYGQAAGTISRKAYQHKAKEFAARYFVERYGSNWDEEFSRALPPEVKRSTFTAHRRLWETALRVDPPTASVAGSGLLARAKDALKQMLVSEASAPNHLRRRIDALHPWYYDVEIGGIKVTPGIGSRQTPEELLGRVEYRRRLLVDEVSKRYDFTRKRLLDVASNCAYWSARYAEMGAASLLAVEGRADYVQQGRLYWDHNDFLPTGSYEFLQSNVMKPEVWEQIRERGPFDLSLCCGILYHVPDYAFLLDQIAAVTREVILIDTRVSDDEQITEEPGGWCFDAIVETRVKKVPSLAGLVSCMEDLGFTTHRLSTDLPVPPGLKDNDDYSRSKRAALLAIRDERRPDNAGETHDR